MEGEYLDRVVDKELDILMNVFGAVLIEGPKWCGKTRTAKKRSASWIELQDVDHRERYLEIAKVAPSTLLKGEAPRLIDEWQTISILWDGVRHEVDRRGKKGQFILTGSVVPPVDATLHTGTCRIVRQLMRPMTLFESLESNGDVSLRSLFNGEDIEGRSSLTLEKLAFALVRGGWPASVKEEGPAALFHAREFVKAIVNTDISRVDGVEKDPRRVRKLMRSLARNISTPVKMKTILLDVKWVGGNDAMSDKTFTSYMNALRRLFVIETLPAWDPAIRSRVTLRTSEKCHFVDPSIATALLSASPQHLMRDFKTFGLLFESLCVRDLRVYAQAMEGGVLYYHDGSGLEVDAIIDLWDGRWGAVEVKMGAGSIDEAAENLKKLRDKIDHEKMGAPSFLMVLTADGFAYRRADGIYVVPIGCLRD